MPIYEYQCQECGEHFDKFLRSFSAEADVVCPKCGSREIRKGFSIFASRGTNGGGTEAVSPAAACAPTG
jgi:putative FmdB family regulatory protein